MKSRTLYILTIAAATMLGCSDDMLDKKSLTSYSEDNVFRDYALLDAYVLGTYRGMGHPFGGEGQDFNEFLTDNSYDQHSADRRAYTRGETNRDNGETATVGMWASSYTNIRRVNVFFEKTEDNTTIATDDLKRANGEMRFLRAFFYAKLVKTYGGVPIITSSVALGQDNYDMTRNTADEVVNFIVSECDQAITELEAFAEVDRGRISKEAAMALKARTLLYAASPLFNEADDATKWQKASDANKAVMETGIPMLSDPAKYHDIFNGRNNEEVILARYFTPQNAHGGGEWGSNLWLYPNGLGGWGTSVPTQNLVDAYEMTNGKPISDPTSGYDDQNPYANRDPRLAETILYNGAMFFDPVNGVTRPMEYYIDQVTAANSGRESRNGSNEPWNSSKTSYNFRKYTDEGKRAMGDKGAQENISPFIYFRMAEFYLNYAECQIRLGDDEAARTAINAVRGRVGMPDVPATETGAVLLARYRNERRVEMAGEELRLDDVRRWKVGPQTIGQPAMGVDIRKNGSMITYDYNYVVDQDRRWNDKMYLFPIPYSEIQASHNALTQNPDY
jgi:starch-binding outer membrane protein, SusD/RagB family